MQFVTSGINLNAAEAYQWKQLPPYIPVTVKNMFHAQVSGDLYMLSGAASVTAPAAAMVHPDDANTPVKFIRVFGEDAITIRAYPYAVPSQSTVAVFSLGCQLARYVWQPGVAATYLFVSNPVQFGGMTYVYAGIAAIKSS